MSRSNTDGLDSMLRASLWAATLDEPTFDEVRRETYERFVPAGGHVLRAGEPADHWYGVIDGLVKMSVTRADGRQASFTGVTAGGWAGEGSLLRPGPWRYDGIAVRPTRMACMPRATFQRLLSTSLPFNHFLLQHVNARLSLFIGLVEFDRLLGPDARVARCLASLFDPDLYPATGPELQLSQEEIGLLSGVSRQRANAALHRLEAQGLLRVSFGAVTVLDLRALRGYSDGAEADAAIADVAPSPP